MLPSVRPLPNRLRSLSRTGSPSRPVLSVVAVDCAQVEALLAGFLDRRFEEVLSHLVAHGSDSDSQAAALQRADDLGAGIRVFPVPGGP